MPRPSDVPWWHRVARWIEHHLVWPVDRAPEDVPNSEDEGCAECAAWRHKYQLAYNDVVDLRGQLAASEQEVGRLKASPERATEGLDEYPLDDTLLHWTGPDGTRWSADADPMADSRRTIGTREPGHAKAPTWTPERVAKLAEESRAKADWQQTRYRICRPREDGLHGITRVDAPFGMTIEQALSNRRSITTNDALRAKLDRDA